MAEQPEIVKLMLAEHKALRTKLTALETAMRAYGHEITPSAKADFPSTLRRSVRGGDEKGKKIAEACVPLIRSYNGVPAPTRNLLAPLKAQGFVIGGKNEVATLSAILSNSGEFESKGRLGWMLKKNETPDAQASGASNNFDQENDPSSFDDGTGSTLEPQRKEDA